jgi:hypothetical protein
MIFSNIFASLIQVIFKPQIIIPMLIVILAASAAGELNNWAIEKPAVDLFLYYDSITVDNTLVWMTVNYPIEIVAMIVVGMIMTVISAIGLLSVSRMSKGKGFIDSINDSVIEWKQLIGLSITLYAFLLFFVAAFGVIAWLGEINQLFSTILSVILLIIAFICTVKIVFIIPALTEKTDKTAKKAIQESWKFTNKLFWKTCIYLLIVTVICFFGGAIIHQIGIIIGSASNAADLIDIAFYTLGSGFALTFFAVAITNFYNTKQ